MDLMNASWFQLPQDQVPSPLMVAAINPAEVKPKKQMPKEPMKQKRSESIEYTQSQPVSVSEKSSWDPLLESVSQGFNDRQNEIKALESRLQSVPEEEKDPFMRANLRPLMALADQFAGTNYSAGYTAPPKENLTLKQKIAEALDKKKQALADDQIALIKEFNDKSQFAESLKQKMDYTNLWGELKKAQIDASAARAAAEKPSTAQQSLAAGFAKRVQQTSDVLDNLASQGYLGLTRADQARQYLPNEMRNPKAQMYDQTARNFINAVLRRESGAAIAQSEFDNAYRQYLPVPGDTAEVLAQKKANRDQVFENFKTEAASAFTKTPYVSPIMNKGSEKIAVSNGVETLMIDAKDLAEAEKDGYRRKE